MYKSFKEFKTDRKANFDENWLPELMEITDVYGHKNGGYTFEIEGFGIIDYFPKANNLLIRKNSKWIKPGLKWIIENILNK